MQKQEPGSTDRDPEDQNTSCCTCDHQEERRLWYEWHQEYVQASEERYNKRIQLLRAACRQQMRNIVAKLHREYEVAVEKLRKDYEKTLRSQKSRYKKTIIKLRKSIPFHEIKTGTSRSSEDGFDDAMLGDTDCEESDDNKIHEKCQNSYQKLQSLLEEKEEVISQLKQEVVFLSENDEMSEYLNTQDKEDFQEKQERLKTASIQTEKVLNKQFQDTSRGSKIAKLKIKNLGCVSVSENPSQDLMSEKEKTNKNSSRPSTARNDIAVMELQRRFDRLNLELLKSYKVNDDLHERVKILQKSFNLNSKKSTEADGPSHESVERMKKIWQKKVMILQGSMHTLRNEMYLRQTLEKQATMLHRAGISYTGLPETPEEPFQAKLMSSGRNLDDQLHPKGSSLPVIQDISQELSDILAANGWWKQ